MSEERRGGGARAAEAGPRLGTDFIVNAAYTLTVLRMLERIALGGSLREEIGKLQDINARLGSILDEIVSIIDLIAEIAEYAERYATKYYRLGAVDAVEEIKLIGKLDSINTLEHMSIIEMNGVIEVEPGE